MGSSVRIRHAEHSDVDVLVELYIEFHEFHARGVPERLRIPTSYDRDGLRARLRAIIDAKDSAVLVAELEGGVVGFAEVYVKEDEANPCRCSHRYAHLQSMMIVERYRRRRVGRQLLSAVEKWGRERHASELRLDTWEFDAGPLGFYEKQGYCAIRRTMVRDLNSQSEYRIERRSHGEDKKP